jgi:hypothetical protein
VPTTTSTTLGPPPPCPGITALQRARIVSTRRGNAVAIRAQLFGLPLAPLDYDPSRDGMAIYFDGGPGDALSIPAGRRGSGCARADGWRSRVGRTGGTYTYRNTSGALPPACGPANAAGLRLVRVQDALVRDGTIHVRVRRFDPTPAAGAGTFDVTIVLGDANAQDMCVRLTLACEGTGPRRTCR